MKLNISNILTIARIIVIPIIVLCIYLKDPFYGWIAFILFCLASITDYFDGYIARLDLRYQFNTELNFRIISEYNEFTDKFFVQPLISWRPNPDTIFYFGGNQNYIDNFVDYNSPNYRVSKTQLFLKFQYLIKS